MTRFRFSLLGLAGATAAVAAAFAALAGASNLVAELTWAGTFFGLTLTLLCAMLLPPGRRGFWTGFALFGWMYVVLTCSPLADRPNVPSLLPLLRQAAEALPQAKALNDATISIDPSAASQGIGSLTKTFVESSGTFSLDIGIADSISVRRVLDNNFIESFVRISQAFIALLIGFIGGVAGHFIRQRSQSTTAG